MTKKRIAVNVISIALVVLLLLGALWFLNRPEEPSEEHTDDKISIFQCDSAAISLIEVTNPSGSYAFSRVDGQWQMRHYEGAALLSDMVDALARSFSDVKSEGRIEENPNDASIYGLSTPYATIHVVADSEEKTFYLGDETSDGVYRYFNTDTSSDVYVINASTISYALRAQSDYRDKVVAQNETSDIDCVEIKKNGTTSILLTLRDGGVRDNLGVLSYWDVKIPYGKSASNEEVSTRILQYAASIKADSYEDYTPANMAAMGLNNPRYNLRVHLSGGSEDNYAVGAVSPTGGRYVYKTGSDYIFVVAQEGVKFLDTDPYDLLEKYVALIEIKKCSQIVMSEGGASTTLSLTDPDGDAAAYYLENQEVDPESFKDFYQKLIGLTIDGEITAAPSGEALYSIVYTLSDGETIKAEFKAYDERNYAVYVGGECEFFIRQKKVESLFNALRELKSNYK